MRPVGGFLWALASLVLAASLFAGAQLLPRLHLFRVESIVIEGAVRTAPEEVRRTTGVQTGTGLLSLDVARAYDVVRIMTGGGPAHRTEMIWTNAGRLAIRNSQFGLASAMSMIGVVLGVLFTLYLFRQLIKSRIVY